MQDIEFIQAEKSSLRHNTIYTYRTGAFAGPVRRKVESIYVSRGLLKQEAAYEPTRFLPRFLEPTLFSENIFLVDIPRAREAGIKDEAFSKLAISLSAGSSDHSFFFTMSADDPLHKDPNWLTFAKTATAIDEPNISKANLAKIAQALAPFCTTYDFTQFNDWKNLAKALEQVLESEEDPTILHVRQRLDECAIFFIDPEANTFDFMAYQRAYPPIPKEVAFETHRIIHDVLAGNAQQQIHLVRLFNRKIAEGQETRMLLGSIHHALRELCIVNKSLGGGSKTPEGWSDYKFATLKDLGGVSALKILWFQIALLEYEEDFNYVAPVIVLQNIFKSINARNG